MRQTWNPTEYLRKSKNPAQTAGNIDAVERWREASLANYPTDLATREAIKLEAHFRHMAGAFIDAQPFPGGGGAVANAVITALAGTLGAVSIEAVKAGFPRDQIILTVMERANAIIDYELRKDAADGHEG